MPKVRCSVKDCFYWNRDNKCGADEVEVRNDQELPNMEIGEIAGEASQSGTSAKTCCKTYKPGK